jgi:multiple sugar transport system substrate-binding protein
MARVSPSGLTSGATGGITRRDFLQASAAIGLSSGGLASLLAACGGPSGGSGPVDLSFVIWSYEVATVQDNIKKFESQHRNIQVKLADFSWLSYDDTMAARFAAKTPTDIAYSSDHWLQQWASAQWIQPLTDRFSDLAAYKDDYFKYVVDGMTYQGKLYGIPYYADVWAFLYNEEHLQRAGISSPPTTWEEVTQQSLELKAKGISDHPVIMLFSQSDPGSIEVWESMVFSRPNGHLFDNALNPVFNQAGSAAAQTIDWLHQSLQNGVLDPASLQSAEIPTEQAMASGAHTFTILETYNWAALNKPGSGPHAGKFKMALMPGGSQNTVGYVRFYSVTSQLSKRPANVISAADTFLQYFGGKVNGQFSPVVVRWAVENGLGFGWKSLWNNSQVRQAFTQWGDPDILRRQQELARVKEGLTPYFPSWDVFTRAELQKAYLGQVSTTGALSAMADKWNQLKKSQ